jgi:hypothetical protein
VEDHVDGVGQPQVGLLHDQLWEGPPYPGQKADTKQVNENDQQLTTWQNIFKIVFIHDQDSATYSTLNQSSFDGLDLGLGPIY